MTVLAKPLASFALPPYRVERAGACAGVVNRDGTPCLGLVDTMNGNSYGQAGDVVTVEPETAERIAAAWNSGAEQAEV